MLKENNIELSIIIVNFGGINYLEKCLLSIREKIDNTVGYEIILVNNDENADVYHLPDKFDGVTVVNSKNNGYGAGNNLGSDHANGKILLFLNPDTEIISGDIGMVMGLFNKDATLGIIGSKLMLTDGKIQEWSCGREASPRELLKNNLGFFSRKRIWLEKKPVRTDWVSGTALFIRRDLFNKLGKFDEKFFMYFEDMDLCKRTRRIGHRVIYNPNFSILHYGGKSYEDKKSQKKDYYNSQEYFFKKHYGVVYAAILRIFRRVLFK